MTPPPSDLLLHVLQNTPELMKRACVVIVVTYLAIRLKGFRTAIRGVDLHWKYRLIAALYFGALAVVGTHNGIVFDVSSGRELDYLDRQAMGLQNSQAIIGFRDTLALSAGLCAGPWVGLGTGLIAGYERYLLGGFVGLASGIATAVLGLSAGLAHRFWPHAVTPLGSLLVALLGTILQKLLLYLFCHPQFDVMVLIWQTAIPVAVVNCFGCLLFVSVMKESEREHLKSKYQLAELRALRAQIEPHFINNTLASIISLTRTDPPRAANYLLKLARFLDETRESAKAHSISLGQEMEQIKHYLDIQKLRFPEVFSFHSAIPDELLNYRVPPRCLLTLIENALLHGMRGNNGRTIHIDVVAADVGRSLALQVSDDGAGISNERLTTLTKQPVSSERGSGNGLHQLSENLKLAFEDAAKIEIKSQLQLGTAVTLKLPKRRQPW